METNQSTSSKLKLNFKDAKYATGRRKTSIAKVWLKKGTGKIYVNGKNLDGFGPRFPDMSEAYSTKLNNELRSIANENNIQLHEGVYVPVSGPNLETKAEYRMIRKLGGDAVGMSTVPEVIVARHMQLPCCAISVLTDECDPEHLEPVDIADILAAAAVAEPQLTMMYTELIARL